MFNTKHSCRKVFLPLLFSSFLFQVFFFLFFSLPPLSARSLSFLYLTHVFHPFISLSVYLPVSATRVRNTKSGEKRCFFFFYRLSFFTYQTERITWPTCFFRHYSCCSCICLAPALSLRHTTDFIYKSKHIFINSLLPFWSVYYASHWSSFELITSRLVKSQCAMPTYSIPNWRVYVLVRTDRREKIHQRLDWKAKKDRWMISGYATRKLRESSYC